MKASLRSDFRRAIYAACLIGLAGGTVTMSPAAEIPLPTILCAEIVCEGNYKQHLQGVCFDGKASLFWCFTSELVKTDLKGKIERKIPVEDHHGDLCFHDGKVYVAVNLGKFNRPAGEADSWVYVYDAGDLKRTAKHEVKEVVHGAGGMAWRDGKFFVVGGLPPGIDENYVYEYDSEFHFIQRHVLKSGYTLMGIQTAAWADGRWWFGCYGLPKTLLTADADFQNVRRYEFDASLGIVPLSKGRFFTARGKASKETGHTARLVPMVADDKQGLADGVWLDDPKP